VNCTEHRRRTRRGERARDQTKLRDQVLDLKVFAHELRDEPVHVEGPDAGAVFDQA
jgi:hypothetical protein